MGVSARTDSAIPIRANLTIALILHFFPEHAGMGRCPVWQGPWYADTVMKPVNLKSLGPERLQELVAGLGQKPYRARQIYRWLYARGVTDFDEMTDLPAELRRELHACAVLPRLERVREERSVDGTRKYLFRLPDGETVETVWIPDERRTTLCISTQVGCAMGCRFCLTAKGGLTRNLETWEIVEQLLEVRRVAPPTPPVTNVVMMGMGEPLANLGAVLPALERLVDVQGIQLAPRKVTVSTVGLVPQMKVLGEVAPYVNLAVSLGGATDGVREQVIPVARKWPLKAVMAACREYPLLARRRILFEYILIKGLNDSPADARELVRQMHGVRCKVNLMACNPIPGEAYEAPDEDAVRAFQRILCASGVRALVRRSRGPDILAACGQLRRAEPEAVQIL